jgi:hypothetical protein
MKKKGFVFSGILVMLLVFGFALIGCSSDDEEEETGDEPGWVETTTTASGISLVAKVGDDDETTTEGITLDKVYVWSENENQFFVTLEGEVTGANGDLVRAATLFDNTWTAGTVGGKVATVTLNGVFTQGFKGVVTNTNPALKLMDQALVDPDTSNRLKVLSEDKLVLTTTWKTDGDGIPDNLFTTLIAEVEAPVTAARSTLVMTVGDSVVKTVVLDWSAVEWSGQ